MDVFVAIDDESGLIFLARHEEIVMLTVGCKRHAVALFGVLEWRDAALFHDKVHGGLYLFECGGTLFDQALEPLAFHVNASFLISMESYHHISDMLAIAVIDMTYAVFHVVCILHAGNVGAVAGIYLLFIDEIEVASTEERQVEESRALHEIGAFIPSSWEEKALGIGIVEPHRAVQVVESDDGIRLIECLGESNFDEFERFFLTDMVGDIIESDEDGVGMAM